MPERMKGPGEKVWKTDPGEEDPSGQLPGQDEADLPLITRDEFYDLLMEQQEQM